MDNLIEFKVFKTDLGISIEEIRQDIIFVVISPLHGIRIKSFDENKRTLWEINSSNLLSRYLKSAIFLIGEKHTGVRRFGRNDAVTKEYFFEFLASNYPRHFEFFIWHPEARNGIWEGDRND